LPWNADLTRKWYPRSLDAIDSIVIHQTVSSSNSTISGINRYHITPTQDRDGDGIIEPWERNHLSPKGSPHIAYTFVIDWDGKVYQCNSIKENTWHSGKTYYNRNGIGIALMGNFSGPGWDGECEPTKEQMTNLRKLTNLLTKRYNIPKINVLGHCEVKKSKKACPGYEIMGFLKNYREG